MRYVSDEELIEELKRRLSEDKRAIATQKASMKQMQELNRQLKESEKSKSGFISNIRNEIINPFTGIQELAASIQSLKADDIHRIHAMAKMIHAAANDLDFQLKNIFEAAAIEAGESIPDHAVVDVNALILDVIKTQEHKIAQKDIQLELEFASQNEPEYFNTDPAKLSLIVLNLLSNAIKFNVEGRKIVVRTEVQQDKLKVVVEDEGIGIKKTSLNKVFNRFKQLGSISSFGGHGLGLSVTKSLVDGMGGTILISNRLPDGTIFTVTLPAITEEQPSDYSENGNEIFFSPQSKF